MKRFLLAAALAAFCLLTFVTRCHNLRDVFIRDHIFFVDADCYSRMTRVQMIEDHPWSVVQHHYFENWPEGVNAHTTAPLDYMIWGLSGVAKLGLKILDPKGESLLKDQALDLAGALVSPLIGVVGAAFLGFWCWALRLRHWGMTLFLYAVSPILVHGTVLGRPDHQSLLMLTLMIGLGAELALAGKEAEAARISARAWGLISGIAWGISLWVSLYEPTILLGLTLILWLAFDRRALMARERWPGYAALAAILLIALLIDGWKIDKPDPVILKYFPLWERTVAELAHLDLRASLLYRWVGWTIIAAPFLMVWARKSERRFVPLLILLTASMALTVWQVRWGYFLAVVYVLALPWVLMTMRRPWIAWTAFILSLWPVAQEWDDEIPKAEQEEQLAIQREEKVRLRDSVLPMIGKGPFLAPWWLSPPIAYWTGDPGVSGSSHEGLSGIVDSARFFLTASPNEAGAILRKREVAWVLADDASRMIKTSTLILGIEAPEKPLAKILAEDAGEAPSFLKEIVQVRIRPQVEAKFDFDKAINGAIESARDSMTFYRLYNVVDAKLPK